MLAKTNLISNAHRLSDYKVAASVTNIYAGQLFQLNNDGEWVYADGTKKAYPTLNDRFPGAGLGLQGERLEGRDNVSRTGKISCLKGNYEIGTDQYVKGATYTSGAPLVAGPGGLARPFDEGTHKPFHIIGYVTQVPETDEDLIVYEG